MKNTKRILLLLLCAVLAVSLLAGCKKKDEETNSGSDSTSDFNYSRDLDDDGFWKDVTATDIVTLPEDYDHFVASRAEVTPSEEDIQNELDSILASYQYTIDVTERSAELNDTVDIDFDGKLADGTTVEGMSGNAPDLVLGSGGMIPGFEDAIVSANAFVGDTFDIEVTFPDPYPNNTDLSGKDAVFTITINKISETIIPELTDAFVADKFGETEGLLTVDEFKADLMESLTEENLFKALQAHLIEDAVYGEIPEKLVTFQEDANYYYYYLLAQSYAANYTSYGMTADDWFYNLTYCQNKEEFTEMNHDYYVDACKESLTMQAIAEKDGITVNEDDIKEYFAANLGLTEYGEYEDYYGIGYLKMVVRNEKAIAALYDKARIAD